MSFPKALIIALLFFSVILPATLSLAEDPPFLSSGVRGYQKFISPVLSSTCYMFPSCSNYSLQAFREYGTIMGLILTVDRLFREADEDQTSPVIFIDGQAKLYDPPSANTFWWDLK
jgi:putative membrane protein insertion efficiency factor